MALTKTITAGNVTESYNGCWSIPITLTIFNDGAEVHSASWSVFYRSGQDPEIKVKTLSFVIQAEINKYLRERGIENNAKLLTVLAWLQTNTII